MHFVINGHEREFPQLIASPNLQTLVDSLSLKSDRIAVEHNGAIVPRSEWAQTSLAEGDKLEIVHFVGGGAA